MSSESTQFKPGNQWWLQRSKHGRDTLFESPELLWQAACEYFQKTDERKWKRKDWVGKDAVEVEREVDTPYTMTGLCLYLGCNDSYFRNFLNQERANKAEFSSVIENIKQVIYTQKFEGAAVGTYNANIIARDLGLRDKTELSTPPDGEGEFKVTLNL